MEAGNLTTCLWALTMGQAQCQLSFRIHESEWDASSKKHQRQWKRLKKNQKHSKCDPSNLLWERWPQVLSNKNSVFMTLTLFPDNSRGHECVISLNFADALIWIFYIWESSH